MVAALGHRHRPADRGTGALSVRRREPADRIATNLEECNELVQQIVANAEPIIPGVEHINRTGGVVAGALPLLYGMAEGIVVGVTPQPEQPVERPPARPASGRRRSRLHDGVGYRPDAIIGQSGQSPQRRARCVSRDPDLS